MGNKKAQVWEEFGGWAVGLIFLAIALLFLYLLSTGRLAAAIEALKTLVGGR